MISSSVRATFQILISSHSPGKDWPLPSFVNVDLPNVKLIEWPLSQPAIRSPVLDIPDGMPFTKPSNFNVALLYRSTMLFHSSKTTDPKVAVGTPGKPATTVPSPRISIKLTSQDDEIFRSVSLITTPARFGFTQISTVMDSSGKKGFWSVKVRRYEFVGSEIAYPAQPIFKNVACAPCATPEALLTR